MKTKRIIQAFFSLLISVFFIILAIQKVDLSKLKTIFLESDFKWIFAAILLLIPDWFFRILRWKEALSSFEYRPKLSTCAGPFLASYAANNVIPFRIGDFLRAFVFSKKIMKSPSEILTVIFVERLLDFLVLLVSLCVVSISLKINSSTNFGFSNQVSIFLIALILFIFIFPQLISYIVLKIRHYLIIILPVKGEMIYESIGKGVLLFNNLSKKRLMLKLLTLTCLSWLFEGMLFWCVAKAIPSLSVPSGSWLAMPVGTLATAIPSSPGYFGTFDFFTMKAMSIFGNSAESSVAYAFLVHFILWIPVTFIGGAILIQSHAYELIFKSKDVKTCDL